jgi:hypothetical protein
MGIFTLKRPTARRLQLVVRILNEHSPQDARKKLARIERELKKIVKSFRQAAAKRRAKRR